MSLTLRKIRRGYIDWCRRLCSDGRQRRYPPYSLYKNWMFRRKPSFMVAHDLIDEIGE